MKRVITLPRLWRLTLLLVVLFAFQNCAQDKLTETTDETLNITEYLKENDDYSMFLEILNVTNYASFMNTYGTYTLFVPNNEAVKAYLQNVGASSVKDVPLADLQNMAKLHILDQKINTTDFTDGKIATPSLYGQFLITGATNKNGTSSITVNKDANIVQPNVELGNGIIHVIDHVLRVADKTLAQSIEENPSLSLFTEALKATGWYEKLNHPLVGEEATNLENYQSVLAQTNAVFEEAGFKTLDDLKARYSHLKDPMNPADSLNLFVSYRVMTRLQYMADMAVTPALETKAPLEIISSKLSKDTLLLNEEVFNGVLEKGIVVDRPNSDVTASNGVLHLVKKNFAIKKRLPAPVYFDLCDQPEFRKLTSIFRTTTGGRQDLGKTDFTDITWDGTGVITYYKDPARGGTVGYGWNGDVVEIYRFRDGTVQNIAFKTPVIIKGKYKVWVSYRTNASKTGLVKMFFNGKELSRQFNVQEYGNVDSKVDERVLESQGYKRYTQPFTNRFNCRLLGVIDVETTGRHTISFQSQASFSNQTWLDVVEFRPIDMDQIYPKLNAGTSGFAPIP
ncbi:fasciclin domain-containing protein [Flavobacterium agrisoli]|uniref:Fasciclin domain-containing protein n=1 Tax=Flavobacterium agrisoli TaxID=2793066 RepID=A0A934PPU0_9FLAO|nr:fasciclin domain-containing protein [Flavobacterium agrisoli]MBK0370699.1 fasciclin domain-containing protein [Flavobacterium agrisoli]